MDLALLVSGILGLIVVIATLQTTWNTAHIGSTLRRIEALLEEKTSSH